jgi:hypothetical protein
MMSQRFDMINYPPNDGVEGYCLFVDEVDYVVVHIDSKSNRHAYSL